MQPLHPLFALSLTRAKTSRAAIALAGIAAFVLLPALAGTAIAQDEAPAPIRFGGPPEPIRFGGPAAVEETAPTPVPDPGSFVRVHSDEGEPAALETATVRYVSADGTSDVTVDLIGVVHFGDSFYYQRLNSRLAGYDALLYELVAPKGRHIPGERRDPFNTILQKIAVALTDLDSQIAAIDYTRPNFVHADLSPRGIAMAMRKRGESRLTLALGALTDMLRSYNKAKWAAEDAARRAEFGPQTTPMEPDPTLTTAASAGDEASCCAGEPEEVGCTKGLPLATAVSAATATATACAEVETSCGSEASETSCQASEGIATSATATGTTTSGDPDSVVARGKSSRFEGVKRAIQHYVVDPHGAARIKRMVAWQLAAPEGGLPETFERILIDDRNEEVIRILEREIAKGNRRIGIFYGAAHMRDLERRLMTEHGMRRDNVEWMAAWDLSMRPRNLSETVFKLMR